MTIEQYADIAIKGIALVAFICLLCAATFGVFGGGDHH